MSDGGRRHDEILGASVVLTGWSPGREADVVEALELLSPAPVDLDGLQLPFVALAKASLGKAEKARELIESAGGVVELRDAWVKRDDAPRDEARPACPFCGSPRTQPFTHAGPAARRRMKCTSCGRAFRADPT